jgi:hypothetical protein
MIPHLPEASPEAVVVGLDRTQAMVSGPSRLPLLVEDDSKSVPGSLNQPHRLHACRGQRRGFMRA